MSAGQLTLEEFTRLYRQNKRHLCDADINLVDNAMANKGLNEAWALLENILTDLTLLDELLTEVNDAGIKQQVLTARQQSGTIIALGSLYELTA